MTLAWPETALQIAAQRPMLTARISRAFEVLRAVAAHSRRPSLGWERRVSAALTELQALLQRSAAERVVQEWDTERPEDVPPASVALASWHAETPRERWSSSALSRAVEELDRAGEYGMAGLVAALSRRTGVDQNESLVDATALAQWALRRPRRPRPAPPPPAPAPAPSAGIAWILAGLAALLLIGGRRRGR